MRFFGRSVPDQKGEFDKLIESIEKEVALEHLSEMIELLEATQFAHDLSGRRDDDDIAYAMCKRESGLCL